MESNFMFEGVQLPLTTNRWNPWLDRKSSFSLVAPHFKTINKVYEFINSEV